MPSIHVDLMDLELAEFEGGGEEDVGEDNVVAGPPGSPRPDPGPIRRKRRRRGRGRGWRGGWGRGGGRGGRGGGGGRGGRGGGCSCFLNKINHV